jgi:PAS domain-containing protein
MSLNWWTCLGPGLTCWWTLTDRHLAERRPGGSEARYRAIFDNARVPVWEQDFSDVAAMPENIRSEGVTDLRSYFQARPAALLEAIERVRLIDVNAFTIELFEADKEAPLNSLWHFPSETAPIFVEELVTLWEGRRDLVGEAVVQTLNGATPRPGFHQPFVRCCDEIHCATQTQRLWRHVHHG